MNTNPLLDYDTLKDPEKVKSAIYAGADVNGVDKDGYTPAHLACQYGCPASLRVLLDAGAGIEARIGFDEEGVDEELLGQESTEEHRGWTPAFFAAQGGSECLSLLRERGADLDAQDDQERTPLYFAAASDEPECVRILLDAGARVNAHADTMRTPLIEASSEGRVENVEMLLAGGANVDVIDEDDETALSEALRCAHWSAAERLLSAGASHDVGFIPDEGPEREFIRAWQRSQDITPDTAHAAYISPAL